MRFAPTLRIPLLLCLAAAALSGCDCSGTLAESCETRADCSAGASCVEGRCVAGDAGGGGDDGDVGDGGEADAFVPPQPDAGPCHEVTGESTVEAIPVDIIITIDNSGSMTEEAEQVRTNINTFAAIIAASGLDYRVVLISEESGSTGVCVPAPLGSGPPACESGPDGRLRALHVSVGSTNAPDRVIAQYPSFVDFLRPESAKVFLWITDDESSNYSADEFRTALAALAPSGMFDRQIHNSIVGYYGETPATWSSSSAGDCDSLADPGETYMRLAQCLTDGDEPITDCTPGSTGRVCETDWTAIFEDIAMGVVAGVPVVCEFAVPAPPEGQSIDVDAARVTYRSGDVVVDELSRVDGEGACGPGGWYFDDLAMPTSITLCPDVCRTVQADPDAEMAISIGCFRDLM